MMMKKFTTTIVVSIVAILLLVSLSFAEKFNAQRAYRLTPEDIAKWEEQLDAIKGPVSVSSPYIEVAAELGRTWYDYATNNITARQMNHSANGLHFAFMKKQPDGTTASPRYVTYDWYDLSLGTFYGNQSVTEAYQTGWGRVLNGVNDEALISAHGNGLRFYQDASEAGYSLTEILHVSAAGVFPGIARLGNTVVFMGQLANGSWAAGDTVMVSTDYMQNWTGHNIWPKDPLSTDYGVGEMWPTINPTNTTEFSVPWCPDITAQYPNGSSWIATTPDLGATWNQTLVWDDDAVFGASQYIIENFGQFNSMYTQDGVYHLVIGAVQGVLDTLTSTDIDMYPILYWNSRDQQMVELTSPFYGRPSNPAVQAALADNRPGNGLGNAYPILAEGPNPGELICIWQQWEDDGAGGIVLLTPTGGSGIQIFATDIWGAYSGDSGMTWSEPFFVAGNPGQSDVYPYLPDKFVYNATQDSIYLDVLWMYDSNPSVSFSNFPTYSGFNEAIWLYDRVAIFAGGPSGIGNKGNMVSNFRLAQNYPNPFNPSTTISFNLKSAGKVALDVYNTLGQKVATVINKNMEAGQHQVKFDASNLASGVYLYKLTSGNLTQTRKMMLMK
jgi:Secretion system C-terminal sorting domain